MPRPSIITDGADGLDCVQSYPPQRLDQLAPVRAVTRLGRLRPLSRFGHTAFYQTKAIGYAGKGPIPVSVVVAGAEKPSVVGTVYKSQTPELAAPDEAQPAGRAETLVRYPNPIGVL